MSRLIKSRALVRPAMAQPMACFVKVNDTMPRVFIPDIVSDCAVAGYYPKE